MDGIDLVELVRQALFAGLVVVAPALVVAFVVGGLMGLVQAATGIHEQVVGLVPRLVAIAATLVALAPWMLERMAEFVRTSAGGGP
ncbi:MAG: flagellar biosynthetic protein FliQ [Planctomycetia bacterium]|nr:flagellar biosynthetic protein FliQ [Planctomycetia bacterium]